MNSTVSRWALLVVAVTLGVVALDTHLGAVLRWALVVAGVLLLVVGVAVRRSAASGSPTSCATTIPGSTAVVVEQVRRTVDSDPLDQPESDMQGTRGAADDRRSMTVLREAAEPGDPRGAPPLVRLVLGSDDAGRRVAAAAADGIAVTGSGALAEAVHLALAEQLLGWGSPGDELRCVGVAPRGCRPGPALVRDGGYLDDPDADPVADADADPDAAVGVGAAAGVDTDANAGVGVGVAVGAGVDVGAAAGVDVGAAVAVGAASGVDADVDVATLVTSSGALRGVLVRSRDTDRPRAVGTVVSVSRSGCRVSVGGAEPVPLDPVLPVVGTGAD